MKSKVFNISLPQELVDQVDRQARLDYSSRSDYIRKALVNQLRLEQSLTSILDKANAKGEAMGIQSEDEVYEMIDATC